MHCYIHPESQANWRCDLCGRDICNRCMVLSGVRPICRKCANVPYPPSSPEKPASHPTVERARICLFTGMMGGILGLFIAFVSLIYLSHLQLSATPSTAGDPDIQGYFILFNAYFLLAMSLFLAGSSRYKQVWPHLKYYGPVLVLMTLPFVVVITPLILVYLVPIARGMLAVMPLLGITVWMYSLSQLPASDSFSEKRRLIRRLLLGQSLLCAGLAAAAELGALRLETLAVTVVFLGLLLVSILLTVEGLWIRDALLAETGFLAPATRQTVMESTRHRLPSDEGIRIAGLCVGFSFALMMGAAVILSPANLDITELNGSTLTIVNRGGSSIGPVGVWAGDSQLMTIDEIRGFEVWKGNLPNNGYGLRLVVSGGVVASKSFHPPPLCGTIPMMLIAVAAAMLMPHRR